MTLTKLAVLVASPCLLLAAPRSADACSAPQCWAGALVPAEGGTVPSTAESLYWHPMSGNTTPDPNALQLTAVSAPGTPLAFTATALPSGDYLINPNADLASGESYRLVDTTACGGGSMTGPAATFAVGPAAPLPATLGTLAATAPASEMLSVGTVSGSCSAGVTAVASTIEITLSADAMPWRDLLHYQTYVDDAPWSRSASINVATTPGSSWVGRGRDVVYRVCLSDDDTVSLGLDEGTHTVRIDATLPGTSVVLASNTVSVTLECEPDGDDDPGDGDDGDAGDDGDTDGSTDGTSDDGGCATGGGSLGGLAIALGALGAVTLRRSRRRG